MPRARRGRLRAPMLLPRCPTLLALAVLPGCFAAPDLGAPRDGLTGVKRVLAPDFEVNHAARRANGLSRLGPGIVAEAQRAGRLTATPTTLVEHDARAVAALPHRLVNLAALDLARGAAAPTQAVRLVVPNHFAEHLANDLAEVPVWFGLAHRPFGELDDRRHRTDPYDDRPEASLWTRLRRRLWL